MTVLATTARTRPAPHTYVMPVVRELPSQPPVAPGSAW
jgi:hypothetical protein